MVSPGVLNMLQSRWLFLPSVALALALLGISTATAQRRGGGGNVCPFAMSMSSQMNVQMTFRQNMMTMNNQMTFNRQSQRNFGSPQNTFARQSTMGIQRGGNFSRQQSSSWAMQTGYNKSPRTTSHQTNFTAQHSCFSSQTSTFHHSLVNYRSNMHYGTTGRHFGEQPTFSKSTLHTTIGMRWNTHTVSTTHRQSTTWGHQINLETSSRQTSSFRKMTTLTNTRQSTFVGKRQVALPTQQKLTTSAKGHHSTPEMQVSVTTKVSATCGRCHANGTPQSSVARAMNPLRPQAGPLPRQTVFRPLVVNVPRPLPSFLTLPPLPVVPARVVFAPILAPILPAFQVPTTSKTTIPLARTSASIRPVVSMSVATSSRRPVDSTLTSALDPPPLPAAETSRPLLYQTADILDRLPSAAPLTLTPKSSTSAAPLASADVYSAPALPGGAILPPLLLEPVEKTVPVKTDSYRDPPDLPTE
jgi:hypothetical protein